MRISYLLLLFSCTSFGVLCAQSEIESLKSELSKAPTLGDSIVILQKIAEVYVYNDTDKAIEYSKILLDRSNASADSSLIVNTYLMYGKVLAFSGLLTESKKTILLVSDYCLRNQYNLYQLGNYLGNIYSALNNTDSTIFYYSLAVENSQNKSNKATIISNLASIHETQGKSAQAVEEYLQSIELIKNEPNADKSLCSFYLNLATLKSNLGKTHEAVKYYKLSIRSAKKANMSYWEGFACINLAGKYELDLSLPDSARHYYNRASRIFSVVNSPERRMHLWSRLGQFYHNQGFADSAVYYFTKAEMLEAIVEDPLMHFNLWLNMANHYLSEQKIPEAKKYAKHLENNLTSDMGLFYLEESYSTISEIYNASGDVIKAYHYLKEYNAIHDSISGLEQQKKISELEVSYETTLKDTEIATLSQQAQIQALQISQRNNQLLGAGVLLLVLILGGVVISQQRKFKHRQAVADMEQRMLRLQMNPHFIFNALASIQNYILQSDTKESVSYLAKFGKLMRQILEHSREEFITIQEEADMLRNYMEIQQLRFKNRFDFSIEVAASIDQEEMKIPPLFAQPFVENAIEHGLKDMKADGHIAIRFFQEGKNVRLEIEDNGSGINVSATTQKEHKSLATIISRERLDILSKRFNSSFSLDVESAHSGKGTRATLILPSLS